MPPLLERWSWIAVIGGTVIAGGGLLRDIFKPAEGVQQHASADGGSFIVQGNGNTIVASEKKESGVEHQSSRFAEVTVSDQLLDLHDKKRHEVHYPLLSGRMSAEASARTNHFLKRAVLTVYERYADWDEVGITYEIGFKEFNLFGINFSIFMGNDGAAHPQMTTIAVVLDLETGSEVQLKDLFRPNYLAQLNKLVRIGLQRQEQYFPCENEKNLDSGMREAQKVIDGVLTEILRHPSKACFKSVMADEQYYLTDTSFVLVFPKYSVAPGASGNVEVRIPYGELKGVLNSKGPLQRFL